MHNINFQDGTYEEITINNDSNRIIRIRTADIGIVERLGEARKAIKAKIEEVEAMENLQNEVDEESAFEKSTEMIKNVNDFIREQTNYIFDSDVSYAAFGNQSPLSTVKGVPLFESFLNAMTPIIEKAVKKEKEASEKRVRKYTERYHK